MDNLVLIRVAQDAARSLVGASLESLRQESEQRFRLTFGGATELAALVISLRPELPWIGRPQRRWEGPRWAPGAFAVAAARALVGRLVDGVRKPPCEAVLLITLGEGRGLAIELATHGGNLVLLDPGGAVAGSWHRPPANASRLAAGSRYRPRGVPEGKLEPFALDAPAIDAFIASWRSRGEPDFETLRRHILGIGGSAARLVVDEAERTGRTPGAVLRTRLDEVVSGRARPVIEGPCGLEDGLERGGLSAERFHLLPWTPGSPSDGRVLIDAPSAAAVSGSYHEAIEAGAAHARRLAGLAAIVRAERKRATRAAENAAESLRGFENPDRFRRQAEALLAGLSRARRDGDEVTVPDPYDPSGADVRIAAPAGRALPLLADDLFRKHRRARRGIEATEERLRALRARLVRLEALEEERLRAKSPADAAALEEALRSLGVAVGLTPRSRAGRAAAAASAPTVAGARLVRSTDGFTILVGRTARDNDRLTFKLAAPDDLWLHAAGVPGAHVIVRVPDREHAVPDRTVLEAAALAARYSDAAREGMVDVHCTPRKFVRRARGGAPGTVVLKRVRTVRVRPALRDPEEGWASLAAK